MLVKVTFEWDDSHGECYDCGRPAAFVVDVYPIMATPQDKFCSVCAANHAAEGSTIYRIEQEE